MKTNFASVYSKDSYIDIVPINEPVDMLKCCKMWCTTIIIDFIPVSYSPADIIKDEEAKSWK